MGIFGRNSNINIDEVNLQAVERSEVVERLTKVEEELETLKQDVEELKDDKND